MGFPCNSVGKESACSAGDPGWIPGLGKKKKSYQAQVLTTSVIFQCFDIWSCAISGGTALLKDVQFLKKIPVSVFFKYK